MNKIWQLSKVQLFAYFDLNKAIHTKDKKEKLKSFSLMALLLVSYGLIAWMLYFQALLTGETMAGMGMPMAIPSLYFTAYFALSFLSATTRGSTLYLSKDWEHLLSLPASRAQLLLGKLLPLYAWELVTSAMFFIPCGIAFARYQPVGTLYPLQVALAVLLVPILPLALGALLSIVTNFIFQRLPFRNIISAAFGLGFVGVIMYFSFQSSSNMEVVMTDTGIALSQSVNRFFPLATWFSDGFFGSQLGYLLLYVLLTAAGFTLFFWMMHSLHPILLERMQYSKRNREYQITTVARPQWATLLGKELRHFFSNSAYVTNTISGGVIVLVFGLIVWLRQDNFLMIRDIWPLHRIAFLMAIVVASMVNMASITSISLSLEGPALDLLKSFPLRPMTIFSAKIIHQLLLFLPFTLVGYGVFAFVLDLPWQYNLLALVLAVLYNIVIACSGLLVNLFFPRLDWTNEVQVIKQSSSLLLGMLANFILTALLVILAIVVPVSPLGLFLLLLGVQLALFVVIFALLKTVGTQRFYELGA